jgi:ferredoxin
MGERAPRIIGPSRIRLLFEWPQGAENNRGNHARHRVGNELVVRCVGTHLRWSIAVTCNHCSTVCSTFACLLAETQARELREEISSGIAVVVAYLDATRANVEHVEREGDRIAFVVPPVQDACTSCNVTMRLSVLDHL